MTVESERDLAALREYYDTTSTAAELADTASGTWETDIEADPMVTTSLRLPKSLLDWVRQLAGELGVKPTALIRSWVEHMHDTAEGPPPLPAQRSGGPGEHAPIPARRAPGRMPLVLAELWERIDHLEEAVYGHNPPHTDGE